MFMQSLENKKLNIFIAFMFVVLFATMVIFAQKRSEAGYWLGSMGYVDPSEGFVPTPDFQVSLIIEGKKMVIVSDENGDFMFLELPKGKYCVLSIQDKEGKVFEIDSNQSKCFEIRKKKTTRFDIIFLRN